MDSNNAVNSSEFSEQMNTAIRNEVHTSISADPVRPADIRWQFPEADQVVIMADLVKDGQDDMQIFLPATATVYESTIDAFGGVTATRYGDWFTSRILTNSSTVTLNGEIIKTRSKHFGGTSNDQLLATDTVHKLSVDLGTRDYTTVSGLAVMVVYSR